MEQATKDFVIKSLEDSGVTRTKGASKIVINDVPCTMTTLKDILDEIPDFWTGNPELLAISYHDRRGAYKKVWREVGTYFQDREKEHEGAVREERLINAFGITGDALVEDPGKYLEELATMIPVIIPSMRESAKRVVLFNPINGKVDTETDPEVFFMFKGVSLKEAIESQMVKIARLEFNPFESDSSYLNEAKHLVLNTYSVPAWRKVDLKEEVKDIPPFIDKLLKHLFPEKEARSYVIAWICRAVLDRNQTILCLIGARGTGKGILAQLTKSLVGTEYSQIVGNSILDDKFNSPMKDNRFICMDEIIAKEQEQINKLKAFSNNFVSLEQKGRDQQTIRNYNSMMITVNEEDSILFSPQDRRFSVPEMSDKDLKGTFAESEITEYVNKLENDDQFIDVVRFGNWILKNGPRYMQKHNNNEPWRFKHFFRVAKANLSQWKLFLEEYIVENRDEIIHTSDVTKAFKKVFRDSLKFPNATATLSKFLRDYLFEGRFRLGDMSKEGTLRVIKVNKDLLDMLNERDPIINDRNDDVLDDINLL